MPLDGLRAWIGELERKLGMRTRIGLVLVALAVGAGGAGIYLALETANDSISKDDLQAVQEEVGSGGAPGSTIESRVEAAESAAKSATSEVAELKAQLQVLKTALNTIAKKGLGAALGIGSGGAVGPEEEESGGTAR